MSDTVDSDDGPECPYCHFVHSEAEDWGDVVSYWGTESGPISYECGSCCLEFKVNEVVSRTWESSPQIQP